MSNLRSSLQFTAFSALAFIFFFVDLVHCYKRATEDGRVLKALESLTLRITHFFNYM